MKRREECSGLFIFSFLCVTFEYFFYHHVYTSIQCIRIYELLTYEFIYFLQRVSVCVCVCLNLFFYILSTSSVVFFFSTKHKQAGFKPTRNVYKRTWKRKPTKLVYVCVCVYASEMYRYCGDHSVHMNHESEKKKVVA